MQGSNPEWQLWVQPHLVTCPLQLCCSGTPRGSTNPEAKLAATDLVTSTFQGRRHLRAPTVCWIFMQTIYVCWQGSWLQTEEPGAMEGSQISSIQQKILLQVCLHSVRENKRGLGLRRKARREMRVSIGKVCQLDPHSQVVQGTHAHRQLEVQRAEGLCP